MRCKRLSRNAPPAQPHATLNFEYLEDRRLLSFTPVPESIIANNGVNTMASAGAQQEPASRISRVTPNGTSLHTSSIAGDLGATALNNAVSTSSISSDSPALSAYVSHNAIATASSAMFAGSLAGTQRSSSAGLDGSYTANEDGMLSVVLVARLSVSTDANKSAYSQAVASFYGVLAVNGDAVIGASGYAGITSEGPEAGDSSIQVSRLQVIRSGGNVETLRDTDFSRPVSSMDAQLATVLSFSIAISAGDEITIEADQFASSDGQASSPSIGVEAGTASSFATLSIDTSFEPMPNPPGGPPLPQPWWRYWEEPPLPDEGGGGGLPFGDVDGDGDIDDDDRRAFPGIPSPIIVSTEDDELDNPTLNPAGYERNDISLREALALAANQAGNDLIVFAPWVNEITLGSQLTVDSDVRIVGRGADKLTINANNASRVFHLNASTVDATISGMTIRGGQVTGSNHGGAIRNDGNLTLDSVVVTDNHATGFGGAIYSVGNAKLRIKGSTFTLNSAGSTAGAIYSDSSFVDALVIERSTFFDNEANTAGAIYLSGSDGVTGTVTVSNSTFSGNRALTSSGGAIKNAASAPPLTIINSTIAYNTSVNGGGGIDMANNPDNRFTLHNTILAHNDATSATTDNLNRAVNSTSSYNVIGYGGTSGLTDGLAGNDLLGSGVSAGLAPLGDYGGKTRTHALLVGSPALDKASNNFVFAHDQRGYMREYDLANVTDGGDGYRDIGAFEAGVGTTLVVRSNGDRNDAITSAATVASLRLREALALAAALAGNEAVSFEKSLYATAPAEIVLSYDGPDGGSVPDSLTMSAGVSIVGPGAQNVIIDGNDLTRVIFIDVIPNDEPISLEGLTITGGTSDVGSGIWISNADVTLRGVRVVDNSATYTGGGIYSENVERLLIVSSEISGNTVGTGGAGGGVYDFRELSGDEPGLQIVNSTISTNSVAGAGGKGGGLYLYRDADGSTALLPIINSTIAFNTAASGGGIYSTQATGIAFVQIHNSIVSDNLNLSAAANNVAGLNFNSGSYNLIGLGGSGGLLDNDNGNIVLSGAETSGLESLGYYDGSTKTHALRYDSAAIDAGFDDFADIWDLDSDQRGFDRISNNDYVLGDGIDIGAMELIFDELYS